MRLETKQRILFFALPMAIVVALAWVFLKGSETLKLSGSTRAPIFLAVSAMYALSHFLRMLRLSMLAIDARTHATSLALMHGLTGLASFFVPFKFGEVLRLGGFALVVEPRKALAVWLCERFADVLVMTILLLAVMATGITLPVVLQKLLVLFTVIGGLGLLAWFAAARMLKYLRAHLVLRSLSPQGLRVLELSDLVAKFENNIRSVLEGRFLGLMLITLLIWGAELLALAWLLQNSGEGNYLSSLGQSIFASLVPNDSTALRQYALLQQSALLFLLILSAVLWWKHSTARRLMRNA